MHFYYLVLCMLLDLKADEIRKSKIMRYQIKNRKTKRGKIIDSIKELIYERRSIGLINKVIRKTKKIANDLELEDDFEKVKEDEENFQEE